jgi:DNA-directed RNA polymerase subunit RPC12/RpoP
MAVKVVGEAPEAVKQATCRHCAARLEYAPVDMQRRDGTDYTGGADGCEWINCPRCGHQVVLRSW